MENNQNTIKPGMTMDVITLKQAIAMGDVAKGKRSQFVYIKPQSPIHSSSDPWNAEQQYELITWDYLVRNYRYSCLDGRYYNAYTKSELLNLKLKGGK